MIPSGTRSAIPSAMTNTITLYNTPTGWIADMSQSAEAADILDLFHTYHLPLPFTSAADARAVLAATIKLNPTATVILR